MKSFLLISLLLTIVVVEGSSYDETQKPLHQQRLARLQQVLETIRAGNFDTGTIFTEAFDTASTPYTVENGYDFLLNLYLSQNIDTLSEEIVKEMPVLEKRVLSHRLYFDNLEERLAAISLEDTEIIPYNTINSSKPFDRWVTVHESDVDNTYVLVYSYQGLGKIEYVLFNDEAKILSMAHIIWEQGAPMTNVTHL